jgi:hypothetical protein
VISWETESLRYNDGLFGTYHVASCTKPMYMTILNTVGDPEDRAQDEDELQLD